ncbi:hypothetical protein BIZ83_gp004 [Erwinia phage vB_EamM_ChrisDB]|uniref:hypothetical protein n=1 Tax=Erwinia phage vB_EamM_ChrisDB TaxID=1883371 RepID=UPI00081CDAA0|nr:hypothetical protein BIZ83_gp004 [Erwinia phage vB_EamM_ChrisDB]ANZ48849.1 hypothetical protein CHRISDB_287 [Erwinia phage vB_EamM_ChrisDB]
MARGLFEPTSRQGETRLLAMVAGYGPAVLIPQRVFFSSCTGLLCSPRYAGRFFESPHQGCRQSENTFDLTPT